MKKCRYIGLFPEDIYSDIQEYGKEYVIERLLRKTNIDLFDIEDLIIYILAEYKYKEI